MPAMCIACAAEDHLLCYSPVEEVCCCPLDKVEAKEGNKRGGPTKTDPESINDPLSTGRKRAAVAFPIQEGSVCEWAGLRSAGGGVSPIVGCAGNPASDRHHGPDKNTLNNEPGNVHRICDHCHNRWHADNDKHYGPRPAHTEPFLPQGTDCKPHDGESKATPEEIALNEMKYFGVKYKKRKD